MHTTTLSSIFTKAWADYRIRRMGVWHIGDENGRTFKRPLFATCLRSAWDAAKVAARNSTSDETARQLVEAQHRANVAKVAAMRAGERSAALSAARDELTLLDYAPFGVRTTQRRADLRATIATLNHGASL